MSGRSSSFIVIMLSEDIRDEEILCRAVPNTPVNWKADIGTLSSAIFLDSLGVSVDRDGERTEAEIVAWFDTRFPVMFGIVSITAAACRAAGAIDLYRPTDDNPFHAEIHQSFERVQLRGGCKKYLRDACKVVRLPVMPTQ